MLKTNVVGTPPCILRNHCRHHLCLRVVTQQLWLSDIGACLIPTHRVVCAEGLSFKITGDSWGHNAIFCNNNVTKMTTPPLCLPLKLVRMGKRSHISKLSQFYFLRNTVSKHGIRLKRKGSTQMEKLCS